MNSQNLEKAKKLLLKEKKRLSQELLSISEKNRKVAGDFNSRFPNWGDDVDSNVAEVDAYSSRLGVEHSLEKMLSTVEAALKKINQGTYGICENCKSEISIARLTAMPAATDCIQCQSDNS